MGDLGDPRPRPRPRCGSTGSYTGGRSPTLQNRLEASVAGLEELNILRENQRLLVNQAKQLLNKQSGDKVKSGSLEHLNHTPHQLSLCSSKPEEKDTSSLHDSGFLESPANRQSSYSGPFTKSSRCEEKVDSSPPIRSPLVPINSRLPENLLKKYKRRPIKPGCEAHFEKQLLALSDESTTCKAPGNDSAFIDEHWDSSDIVTDNILTVFAQQYTKPKTLQGSQVTYHFPSPMHAVLLQYNQSKDGENTPSGQEYYRTRRKHSLGSSSSTDTLKMSEGNTTCSTPLKSSSIGDLRTSINTKCNIPIDKDTSDISNQNDDVFDNNSVINDDDKPPPLPLKNKDKCIAEKDKALYNDLVRTSTIPKLHKPDSTQPKLTPKPSQISTCVKTITPKSSLSSIAQLSSSKSPPYKTSSHYESKPSQHLPLQQAPFNSSQHLINQRPPDLYYNLSHRSSLDDIHENKEKGFSRPKTTQTASRRSSRTPSTRSNSSSRISLASSEEGYFSHPGSPKIRRRHHKLSIQSDVSFGSTGSNLCVAEHGSDEENSLNVGGQSVMKDCSRSTQTDKNKPLEANIPQNICTKPADKHTCWQRDMLDHDKKHSVCFIKQLTLSDMEDTFV